MLFQKKTEDFFEETFLNLNEEDFFEMEVFFNTEITSLSLANELKAALKKFKVVSLNEILDGFTESDLKESTTFGNVIEFMSLLKSRERKLV